MAQRWVTSRGLDGLPTDRQAMLDALWFNMWRARLRPYRELGAGDTVFFYDPSSRRVRWRTRVSRVFTDTYESKTAAARVMARTFGGSQAAFTGSAYFQQAPPAGHLLAWTNDDVGPVDLAKPEGVRFPQQGWLRVDDLAVDERARWGFDPPPQGSWAGGLPDARSLLGQLVGQLLRTLHGRPNRILDIREDDVIVATQRSPEGQAVPIADVQHALELLARDGEVVITPEVVGHRSAFIGAVLRTLPGTTIATNPPRVYATQAPKDMGAVARRQRRRLQEDTALAAQILQRLGTLRRWTRDQTVAVHKPLLLLMAFARVRQGLPRLVVFPEIEAELRTLIAEFSSLRGTSIHPEYPFWRLQNDGLWEVVNADDLPSRASNTDPPVSVLRSRRVQGGLPTPYYELLRLRGDVLEQAVDSVLALLPPEQRASVLARVGWDDTPPQTPGEFPSAGPPPVGVPFQSARPTAPTADWGPYEVDPDKVDRGRQAHEDTLEALAAAVRAQRLEPLEPEKGNPPYDLAWETPTAIFVAEVKSLTLANAEHQLRLGLGQVLRYWHAMANYDKPVIPILAVEQKPEDSSWLSLCERLGVHLVWPESMPEAIAVLSRQPQGSASK